MCDYVHVGTWCAVCSLSAVAQLGEEGEKYVHFCSHLAKIRGSCKIGGALSCHFLEGSMSKVATTGAFLIIVWCDIHKNHV